MKQTKSFLPLAAGLGALGLVLERLLYALALDERGLLVRGHPLSLLLCLLIPVDLVVAILAARRGAPPVPKREGANTLSALSQGATAVAIACTVLATDASSLEGPGRVWQIFGLLSAGGLLWAAGCRFRGKKPSFVSDLLLCLFLLAHLVSHYRKWCADPQIMDYLFELLGVGAWMLFAYYCACARVGLGKPRMHLATGLLTVTLCLTALGGRGNWVLCLGGALFAAASLAFPAPGKEAP